MQALVVAFMALALCLASVGAFFQTASPSTMTRQRQQVAQPQQPQQLQRSRFLEMKGKGNRVPIDQRGEFMKQQRMLEMREKMKSTKAAGVPVFKVFVRPKVGGLWIPCGDLAGDQRATALVNAWTAGFMSGMYKEQLDQGIAKSIFSQESTFINGLIENYKPFKRFKPADLEFGYKIDFEGLEEKMGEQRIQVITREMEKGWFDKAKDSMSKVWSGEAIKEAREGSNPLEGIFSGSITVDEGIKGGV